MNILQVVCSFVRQLRWRVESWGWLLPAKKSTNKGDKETERYFNSWTGSSVEAVSRERSVVVAFSLLNCSCVVFQAFAFLLAICAFGSA